MVKITTSTHGIIESHDSFATIQNAIKNKQFIEVNHGLTRFYINPEHIVTLEGDQEAVKKVYQNPAASNFPFPMTAEETEAMQNKLQPMKVFFDQKKKAMEEMKQKENDVANSNYATMYGKFKQDVDKVAPVVEAPVETVAHDTIEPVAKKGRPAKDK